ncbi:electron transport complex protein RnfD [Natranaerovirga pectinivora]|uniref:Ion-translocating oxidoreductase complex subunit D n=1 Tax=Natranaerovirga pectinivora TaxID=682400 RepID=A0A4R3MKQ3_9FIRM|nr:RnfABCDGE type electron transport complex subunit D [Natranaerovirga pectinivora]TCT14979.1 electron transport complex protein RnfD [Natranaerovirga pectinivora]
MTDNMLVVSSSPHMRSNESTQTIMRDVIIALLPATFFAVYNFGSRALIVTILAILGAVASEWLFQKATGRKNTVTDLSAALTGLFVALNIPYTVPFWIPVIGSAFAIIVVKQIFGGLGQNFMNPALAARAFLVLSFPRIMSIWSFDSVTSATPLDILKAGGRNMPSLQDAFLGNIGGSLGEVSAAALLIGAAYLLIRKVITWRIPFVYIGTTIAVIAAIQFFNGNGFDINYLSYHVFTGGLILGAFFMATDYASSPVTPKGQIIFAIGAGIVTAVIRLYSGMPEGVSYAILFMNLWVPIIERFTIPKAFGEGDSHGKK